MGRDHHHKFDPANLARLEDPRRRELLPPGRLIEALPLRRGQRVADVGCGAGYWLFALLDAAPPGVRFWGVDTEPVMLHHLEGRLGDDPRRGSVTMVRSTETAVPLPDGSLDVVVMGLVYHELADRRAYLAELRRLLAPSGRLALVDWDVLPPGVERTMGPPVGERVGFETALVEVEQAGFVDVSRVDGFREAYALVARQAG